MKPVHFEYEPNLLSNADQLCLMALTTSIKVTLYLFAMIKQKMNMSAILREAL